jgi:hypothetical protein
VPPRSPEDPGAGRRHAGPTSAPAGVADPLEPQRAAPAPATPEERILAVRANGAPDVLARIGVLVARRGASLRAALTVRDPSGERCELALVVAGPALLLGRLPLWIGGLADVEEVQDLSCRKEVARPW